MKKYLTTIVLALMSMIVSLSACGGSDDSGAKPDSGSGDVVETVDRTLAKGQT